MFKLLCRLNSNDVILLNFLISENINSTLSKEVTPNNFLEPRRQEVSESPNFIQDSDILNVTSNERSHSNDFEETKKSLKNQGSPEPMQDFELNVPFTSQFGNTEICKAKVHILTENFVVDKQIIVEKSKEQDPVAKSSKHKFHCEFPNCGKSYTKKDHLNRHLKKHDMKPYTCRYCEFKCTRSDELTRHERKHSVEKTFDCEFCTKSYSRMDYLRLHMKRHMFSYSRVKTRKLIDKKISPKSQMFTKYLPEDPLKMATVTENDNDKAEMESNSILSMHPTVLSLSFNNTKENDSSDETLKNLSVSNSLDEVNKHDLEKSNEAKYQGTISKREGKGSNNIQSKKTEGNLDLKLQSGLENDQISEKKDTHFSSKVKIEVKEEVDDELRNGFEVLDTINFQ